MMILTPTLICAVFLTQEICALQESTGYLRSRKLLMIGSDDDCGKPKNPTDRVIKCFKGFHAHAFISTCKSYPSQPRNLSHSFHFDKSSKELSLKISWDEPEYGQNTLWGYDVLLSGGHYLSQRCFQINGKEQRDRNFTFNNVKFDADYLIIVSTLPRRDRSLRKSIERKVHSPEKCKVYKKENIELPLPCQIIKNFRVEKECNRNGTVFLSWNKPNFDYDQMYMEIECACSETIDLKIQKDATSKWLRNLKNCCKYTVLIYVYKTRHSEFYMMQNVTFQCRGEKTPRLGGPTNFKTHTKSKETFHAQVKVIIYLIPITIAILIALGLGLFLLYLRRKKILDRNFKRLRAQSGTSNASGKYIVANCPDLNKNNESLLDDRSDENKPSSVMILHSCGCRDVDNFVLLLANFLNCYGIHVRLDLLESKKMASAGAAVYLEATEQESTYVIIVCTKDLESEKNDCNKPLRFILNIIKNNIMNSESCSKYIPVYIESSSYVPSCLQGTSTKVPGDLETIIQRILDIQRYQLSSNNLKKPVKNELKLDQNLMENLKLAANNVSKIKHDGCSSNSCSKGISLSEPDMADSFDDLLLD